MAVSTAGIPIIFLAALGSASSSTLNNAHTSSTKSRELVDKLLELDKMKPDIAYQIANVMPKTRDEVRAIFGRDKFITHTTEDLDQIVELVAIHLI